MRKLLIDFLKSNEGIKGEIWAWAIVMSVLASFLTGVNLLIEGFF